MARKNTEKLFRLPNRIPIADVDELKKIVGKGNITSNDFDYAIVIGKDNYADGNNREYYWDSTSNDPADDDDFVKPDALAVSDLGRWVRVGLVRGGGTGGGGSVGTKKTFHVEIAGTTRGQNTFEYFHNFNNRNIFVQVTKVDAVSGGSIDQNADEVVNTGVQIANDWVRVIFDPATPPQAGERFIIKGIEI